MVQTQNLIYNQKFTQEGERKVRAYAFICATKGVKEGSRLQVDHNFVEQ